MKKILCLLAILFLIASTFLISCGNSYAFPNSPTLFHVEDIDKVSLLSWVRSNHPYATFRDNVQPYEDGAYSLLGVQVFTEYRLAYYFEWVHDNNDWIDVRIRRVETDNFGGEGIYYPYNGTIVDVVSLDTSYPLFTNYGDWYSLPNPQQYLNLHNYELPSADNNYQNGYDTGYVEGLTKGYGDAYSEQYEQMTTALDTTDNIGTGIIGGFLSGFNGFLSTILSGVTLGGVVLLSFVSTIIFIVVAYKVIKMVK